MAGAHWQQRWRPLGPTRRILGLYLGRPRPSVVIEAYRHLVDPFDGMTGDMVQPRRLLLVEVGVSDVLDLRDPAAAASVGLSEADLLSPVGEYEPCWQIARAAHQLGLHGIVAPAATGLGETFAIFEEHLSPNELPRLVGEELWEMLPADPRRLRAVKDEDAS